MPNQFSPAEGLQNAVADISLVFKVYLATGFCFLKSPLLSSGVRLRF